MWQRPLYYSVYISVCFSLQWFGSYEIKIPGTQLQASVVSKKLGALPSWLAQLDSPGTAVKVGGWIRPGEQN